MVESVWEEIDGGEEEGEEEKKGREPRETRRSLFTAMRISRTRGPFA